MNRQTNKTKYRNTHIQTHKPKPKKKITELETMVVYKKKTRKKIYAKTKHY